MRSFSAFCRASSNLSSCVKSRCSAFCTFSSPSSNMFSACTLSLSSCCRAHSLFTATSSSAAALSSMPLTRRNLFAEAASNFSLYSMSNWSLYVALPVSLEMYSEWSFSCSWRQRSSSSRLISARQRDTSKPLSQCSPFVSLAISCPSLRALFVSSSKRSASTLAKVASSALAWSASAESLFKTSAVLLARWFSCRWRRPSILLARASTASAVCSVPRSRRRRYLKSACLSPSPTILFPSSIWASLTPAVTAFSSVAASFSLRASCLFRNSSANIRHFSG
mmetsp:Transcript_108472/g.338083  ORF Transcript_108472/g.338083 Transcript_108472/m.338083 type:complete len:280 (+) Transcript_108472:388-1227(+)